MRAAWDTVCGSWWRTGYGQVLQAWCLVLPAWCGRVRTACIVVVLGGASMVNACFMAAAAAGRRGARVGSLWGLRAGLSCHSDYATHLLVLVRDSASSCDQDLLVLLVVLAADWDWCQNRWFVHISAPVRRGAVADGRLGLA